MITACAWCCRETVRGTAVGAPLPTAKYNAASHGHCVECGDDFGQGFSRKTMVARMEARLLGLVDPPETASSNERQPDVIAKL